MPLRDGFFSTATQTSCCNRIQRSNRVRLLVVSTHDFPDIGHLLRVLAFPPLIVGGCSKGLNAFRVSMGGQIESTNIFVGAFKQAEVRG